MSVTIFTLSRLSIYVNCKQTQKIQLQIIIYYNTIVNTLKTLYQRIFFIFNPILNFDIKLYSILEISSQNQFGT